MDIYDSRVVIAAQGPLLIEFELITSRVTFMLKILLIIFSCVLFYTISLPAIGGHTGGHFWKQIICLLASILS